MHRVFKLAVIPIVAVFLLATAAPAFADFVCPVFKSSSVGQHNPNAEQIGGGDYAIVPQGADHLNVPDHATNMDGAGSPGGAHARPGDRDYSAIWNSP